MRLLFSHFMLVLICFLSVNSFVSNLFPSFYFWRHFLSFSLIYLFFVLSNWSLSMHLFIFSSISFFLPFVCFPFYLFQIIIICVYYSFFPGFTFAFPFLFMRFLLIVFFLLSIFLFVLSMYFNPFSLALSSYCFQSFLA